VNLGGSQLDETPGKNAKRREKKLDGENELRRNVEGEHGISQNLGCPGGGGEGNKNGKRATEAKPRRGWGSQHQAWGKEKKSA